MILVDANLLVYAYVSRLPQHKAAAAWLDERLNGAAPVGLPWPSLLALVRLVSNPRVFERPKSVAAAWKQVEDWLDCPPVWVPQPTERHREILGSLLKGQAGRANQVPPCPPCRTGDRTWIDSVLHGRRFRPFSRSALRKPPYG